MQTQHQNDAAAKQASLEKLVECYRHELSAVETYQLALKGVTHVGLHRALQEILVSHSGRVDKIRASIGRQGGEVPTTSGVWGAFAQLVQAGADLLGDRAAIGLLEQGEDRGMELYSAGLEGCDASTRNFIASELLPRQSRTHEFCRTLKNFAKAPS